jgi:hypothetical protein
MRCRLLAFLCAGVLGTPGLASASEVVDQNPFDPGRKPWKQEKAVPELPELTPKDLQIDAIISFGAFRGIIVQLDGKLKGALPANAAGKVRIQVGQNFGGGYVLAAIEPNQAVIQTGAKRFFVPLLRKISKGGPPAPALQAAEPAPAPSPFAPSPGSAPAAPAPTAVDGQPVGLLPAIQQAAADAQQTQQPAQPAEPAASNAQPGQPMSLLDAIRRAQEATAAKARTGGAATGGQQGIPFTGKQ